MRDLTISEYDNLLKRNLCKKDNLLHFQNVYLHSSNFKW